MKDGSFSASTSSQRRLRYASSQLLGVPREGLKSCHATVRECIRGPVSRDMLAVGIPFCDGTRKGERLLARSKPYSFRIVVWQFMCGRRA